MAIKIDKLQFFNFNMGFAIPTDDHGRSNGYVLDEHGDRTLLLAEDHLFYEYVEAFKNHCLNAMIMVDERDTEVDKMIEEGYKTFDPETLRIDYAIDPRRKYTFIAHDVGNLAMLSVYHKDVYDKTMAYVAVRFPEETDRILNSGKEAPARDGKSIIEVYINMCNELVVPKFPIK